MRFRFKVWKDWYRHCTGNTVYKLLVLFKLRHSPSFEFLYIRETCIEKYGCSPFAEDHINLKLIKRVFKSYDKESEE